MTQLRGMFDNFLQWIRNVSLMIGALGAIFAAFFSYTAPDPLPIKQAEYEVIAIGSKLYFKVDIAHDATYGAELVLYVGNDYLGSLPIPQVGHRVTTATYNLPPNATKQSKFKLNAYWTINHWTNVIFPSDIFKRLEVINAKPVNNINPAS